MARINFENIFTTGEGEDALTVVTAGESLLNFGRHCLTRRRHRSGRDREWHRTRVHRGLRRRRGR